MARKESVFWLFCTLALMMSVVLVDAQTFFTNGRYGKRSEVRSRVASRSADERFFGGPRFGRSGNGGIVLGNSELDARNPERFFIGSRYGKRSEMEQIVPSPQVDESTSNSQEKETFLECNPIGIEQLYHCIERKNGNVKNQEGA
ncbi:uncharacterized protein LOC124193518 isoform X1 [Daphnia pulex]|uniref:uncharacterized protein LOC124193518 isoform X1 n=1 Tax=Daphnia pulex TaxID=6669 RepID=UPI001EDEC09F|nr:uncharacterized protein LOC124193518 isoform X1 [Daphnia pulex]XP_046633146.1 uncharacterized protein LOC124312698 isoform X1 [Daphnia pulicaria]